MEYKPRLKEYVIHIIKLLLSCSLSSAVLIFIIFIVRNKSDDYFELFKSILIISFVSYTISFINEIKSIKIIDDLLVIHKIIGSEYVINKQDIRKVKRPGKFSLFQTWRISYIADRKVTVRFSELGMNKECENNLIDFTARN